LTLTAYHWEAEGGGVFVNTFNNVIPAEISNSSVKVYLVANGEDTQIDQPFGLQAGPCGLQRHRQRKNILPGNAQNVVYLNIKLVIGLSRIKGVIILLTDASLVIKKMQT
jgi:hypothetical protein